MGTRKSPRMYNNQILELLSLSGPRMMIPFHLLIISSQVYAGIKFSDSELSIWSIFLWFLAGLSVWTLAEYILHRYLFHFESDNRIVKAFHFAMHGYHHDHPNDANRLFMPPVPALIFLLIFFGLFYLIMGLNAFFFLAGFELGYLFYSFIHYCIHTRKAPKRMHHLWHHHIIHHYKEPEKAFGVSSRFWDRLFRTLPKE